MCGLPHRPTYDYLLSRINSFGGQARRITRDLGLDYLVLGFSMDCGSNQLVS